MMHFRKIVSSPVFSAETMYWHIHLYSHFTAQSLVDWVSPSAMSACLKDFKSSFVSSLTSRKQSSPSSQTPSWSFKWKWEVEWCFWYPCSQSAWEKMWSLLLFRRFSRQLCIILQTDCTTRDTLTFSSFPFLS